MSLTWYEEKTGWDAFVGRYWLMLCCGSGLVIFISVGAVVWVCSKDSDRNHENMWGEVENPSVQPSRNHK